MASGPGAVTLDAVAAAAGVSKGGLLYHFRSKDALVAGLLERLRLRGAEDVERMRADPAGAVSYYLRTSASALEEGPLHRTMVAALSLAQSSSGPARETLGVLNDAWYALLREEVGDARLARLVQLVGDGMWLAASTGGEPDDVDDIVGLLRAVGHPPQITLRNDSSRPVSSARD
ncbi:TetR/AcrR family transcriptional regulator [Kineococcus glutinatus]|uniref:TetR/AcrR family transcriptional regulator n=1 Tax=Kineococcus glutinatus TaxID=1070872 RepID=A0ABP8VF54_9ACTN